MKLQTVAEQAPRQCISSLAKAARGGTSSKAALRQTSDTPFYTLCAFIKVGLTVVSASR